MSRELIFRRISKCTSDQTAFFNLKEGEIYQILGIGIGKVGLEIDIFNLPDADFYPIDQYTGLKDCNGKMIFENDVVGIVGCEDDGIVSFDEFKFVFYLEDKDPDSGFFGETTSCNLGDFESKELKVIGNVHEGVRE